MTRQVFFSFHYARDIWRINPVRNAGAFNEVQAEGFFDHSLWESSKATGDQALRSLINNGMRGSSVVAVLIGRKTYGRRWVRYEIEKAADEGRGLLGVYIHGLRDQRGQTDLRGPSPFSELNIRAADGTPVATYDWVTDNGYHRFADWVETAAQQAGR